MNPAVETISTAAGQLPDSYPSLGDADVSDEFVAKVKNFEAEFSEVSRKLGVNPELLYTEIPERSGRLPTQPGEPILTWFEVDNPKRYADDLDGFNKRFKRLPESSLIAVRQFLGINKQLIAGGASPLDSVQAAEELDLFPVSLTSQELSAAEEFLRDFGIEIYYQELLWASIEMKRIYQEGKPDREALLQRIRKGNSQIGSEELEVIGHDEIWENFKPQFHDPYIFGGGERRVSDWDQYRRDLVCWMYGYPGLQVNWELYEREYSQQWVDSLSCRDGAD